jgi:hAT family C-terminal dimerisation region
MSDNQKDFPTVYRIALDYMPVQASAVPCERVFSSASETDTKRRNRLNPNLFEALQVMKFAMRRERLDFTQDILTPVEDMVLDPGDDEDVDPLAGLLMTDANLGEEAFDRALAAICVNSDDEEGMEQDGVS